jgi:ABC-type nitrate/sulfonate/bicarbonate transport system substrate-binding protein
MPAGMPVWMTAGGMNNQPIPVTTALTLTRNGNGITLDKRFVDQGIRTLEDLRQFLLATPTQRHTFGVAHPASNHNLLLRYWLAAGGIDPQKDVTISTLSPAQMIANLQAGNIDGYSIGEPWITRAVTENIGYEIASDLEIWEGHPGKVLGAREDWALAYPNTHVALVKALLDACRYCAKPDHHEEVRDILAGSDYLAMDRAFIYFSDDPTPFCNLTQTSRELSHHLFFGDGINRPSRTEHPWMLTQLARWGDVAFPRNWVEVLERVCKVSVFSIAARELELSDGMSYSRGAITLFDGVKFTADEPIHYLNQLEIKHDIYMAEIPLGTPMPLVA